MKPRRPRTLLRSPELDRMRVLDFLRTRLQGRPVDSLRLEELLDAYEEATLERVLDLDEVLRDVPTIDLRELALDPAVLVMVPRGICERHRAIPVTVAGKVLIVAMAEPSDVVARDELAFLTGLAVEPVAAPEEQILAIIARSYGAC